MKFAAPKIRLACSVGIYLADTHIGWCVLEKSLLGTRRRDAGEEPCVKQDWAVALDRVLERAKTMVGDTASVVIGLPASHTFFATLPHGGKGQSAEALLAGHHCCTSIAPADLSADMLTVKVGGRTFAAIGASRRKELSVLLDVARKRDFRFIRVEPAPWALLRVSSPLRGQKIALRLLLDGPHLIAVLVAGQQPLLWRSMELPGDEASAELIVSMVRTFESYASQQLGIATLDAIILEGEQTAALASRLSLDLGERFSAIAGPGPTVSAISRGLAVGGLERDKPAPDLARPLAPPPQLWDLVPRGEVALLGAVVVCMGLWLWGVGTVAQNNARRIEEDNARNTILKIEDTRLKDEKKTLGAEVAAVHSFLSNRILWTEYLSQLSGRVPDGVKFVSMQGEYELSAGGDKGKGSPKKVKRMLMMTFTGTVPPHLSAPPEVARLMEGIRSAPAVLRDFPDVRLSSLRVTKTQQRNSTAAGDPATFMITCLPRGADKKPSAGGGEKAVASAGK